MTRMSAVMPTTSCPLAKLVACFKSESHMANCIIMELRESEHMLTVSQSHMRCCATGCCPLLFEEISLQPSHEYVHFVVWDHTVSWHTGLMAYLTSKWSSCRCSGCSWLLGVDQIDFLNVVLCIIMISLCGEQRSKVDSPEVAVPLEDYSVYASSSAHDCNKVIFAVFTNNIEYYVLLGCIKCMACGLLRPMLFPQCGVSEGAPIPCKSC